MPNLKPIEILLIVLVVLLLFGAKRLPDLARSVGKSLKILKTEVKDLRDDETPAGDATAVPPTASVPQPIAPTAPGPNTYRDPVNYTQPVDDTPRKQV